MEVQATSAHSEMNVSNAEEIAKALKPMKYTTNIMSQDSKLSMIAPLHVQLLHDTEAGFAGVDTPIVWEIKAAIHKDSAKRYTRVQKSILHTASTHSIQGLTHCLSFLKKNSWTSMLK